MSRYCVPQLSTRWFARYLKLEDSLERQTKNRTEQNKEYLYKKALILGAFLFIPNLTCFYLQIMILFYLGVVMLKPFESSELLQIMERIDNDFFHYWLPTALVVMFLARYFIRRAGLPEPKKQTWPRPQSRSAVE